MNIQVKLYGSLRDHLPQENKGETTLQIAPGSIVRDILQELEISQSVNVAINDEVAEDTSELAPGDCLSVFGEMAGGQQPE